MSSTEQQTLNGVDIDQLTKTIDLIRKQPELASFRFRATNRWLGGARSRTSIHAFYGAGREDNTRPRAFQLDGDEPPVLLGENSAPNAVEAVLHALASCLAVGFTYNAAARGIAVRKLEFDLEGELDLHGFLGLSADVRAGYRGLRVAYRVDCDASAGDVDELCAHVQRTSPVLDMLRNNVHVDVARVGS
jgi:uncharacterized OsmC-like protein